MSGSDHRRSKKAGLSGLFRACVVAAALLMSSATVVMAEPLAVDVIDAKPIIDQRTNQPTIVFQMARASTKQFAEFTTQNVGRRFELRVDGKTVISSVLREPIMTGSGQISGSWTLREAKDHADSIAAGKSKVEVELANE
jgi:preprotein translocase subunit SecD